MSGYDGAAWLQFHRGSRLGTIPVAPQGDRHRCPHCGLFMTRDWFRTIYGCEPERYGRVESPLRVPLDEPAGYIDPTEEQGYNVEHRSVR